MGQVDQRWDGTFTVPSLCRHCTITVPGLTMIMHSISCHGPQPRRHVPRVWPRKNRILDHSPGIEHVPVWEPSSDSGSEDEGAACN